MARRESKSRGEREYLRESPAIERELCGFPATDQPGLYSAGVCLADWTEVVSNRMIRRDVSGTSELSTMPQRVCGRADCGQGRGSSNRVKGIQHRYQWNESLTLESSCPRLQRSSQHVHLPCLRNQRAIFRVVLPPTSIYGGRAGS